MKDPTVNNSCSCVAAKSWRMQFLVEKQFHWTVMRICALKLEIFCEFRKLEIGNQYLSSQDTIRCTRDWDSSLSQSRPTHWKFNLKLSLSRYIRYIGRYMSSFRPCSDKTTTTWFQREREFVFLLSWNVEQHFFVTIY